MHYEITNILVKDDGYILPRWMPTTTYTAKENEYTLSTHYPKIPNVRAYAKIQYTKQPYPLQEIVVIR